MMISDTSNGVGVNVRMAGHGLSIYRNQVQLQLSNNHHLADFNVSTHGGEVVSQEDWKYAH